MQILQFVAAHAPVAIGTQRLADALWPEADGDKAMRSLDVSLNRLRQVLPDAGLLFRRDGKVGLDMDRVWCDTYAVLGLVERLRSYVNANGGEHPVNDERLQEAYDAPARSNVGRRNRAKECGQQTAPRGGEFSRRRPSGTWCRRI